jgi:hypothetical protein
MANNAAKRMKINLKCHVCGDNSFGVNYGNLFLTHGFVLNQKYLI